MILYVDDLEASIAWYRERAGLSLNMRGDGYAEFATQGTKLALFERSLLPGLVGGDGAARRPDGEIVFVVEDVDAMDERLRVAGVRILSGLTDRAWGHRTLHVLDVDGHVVEFAQEIPRRPVSSAKRL